MEPHVTNTTKVTVIAAIFTRVNGFLGGSLQSPSSIEGSGASGLASGGAIILGGGTSFASSERTPQYWHVTNSSSLPGAGSGAPHLGQVSGRVSTPEASMDMDFSVDGAIGCQHAWAN